MYIVVYVTMILVSGFHFQIKEFWKLVVCMSRGLQMISFPNNRQIGQKHRLHTNQWILNILSSVQWIANSEFYCALWYMYVWICELLYVYLLAIVQNFTNIFRLVLEHPFLYGMIGFQMIWFYDCIIKNHHSTRIEEIEEEEASIFRPIQLFIHWFDFMAEKCTIPTIFYNLQPF